MYQHLYSIREATDVYIRFGEIGTRSVFVEALSVSISDVVSDAAAIRLMTSGIADRVYAAHLG